MALKEKIKRRRRLIGLTQVDLARTLGLGISTVARWEQGLTEPKLCQLRALAKLFLSYGAGIDVSEGRRRSQSMS